MAHIHWNHPGETKYNACEYKQKGRPLCLAQSATIAAFINTPENLDDNTECSIAAGIEDENGARNRIAEYQNGANDDNDKNKNRLYKLNGEECDSLVIGCEPCFDMIMT